MEKKAAAKKMVKQGATKTLKKKVKQPLVKDIKDKDPYRGLTRDMRGECIKFEDFDVNRLILTIDEQTDEKKKNMPSQSTKGTAVVEGYRIRIDYKYDQTRYGKCLLFIDDECFTFGTQENLSKETEEVIGHSMSFTVFNRKEDDCDPMDKPFIAILYDIVDHIRQFMLERCVQLGFSSRCTYGTIEEGFIPPIYPRANGDVDFSRDILRIYPKFQELKQGVGRNKRFGEDKREEIPNATPKFKVFTRAYIDDQEEADTYCSICGNDTITLDILSEEGFNPLELEDCRGYGCPLICIDNVWISKKTAYLQLRLKEVSGWRYASNNTRERVSPRRYKQHYGNTDDEKSDDDGFTVNNGAISE